MSVFYISEILRDCLSKCCSYWRILETNCSEIKKVVKYGVSGLYAFVDGETVYYVGRSENILRRVGVEHCRAHIGSSEGVVIFLMYLLDQVCSNREGWINLHVVEREKVVSEIIRKFLAKLKIVIALCSDKPSRKCLAEAEECAKIKLAPYSTL